jgi:hypothetical protein
VEKPEQRPENFSKTDNFFSRKNIVDKAPKDSVLDYSCQDEDIARLPFVAHAQHFKMKLLR